MQVIFTERAISCYTSKAVLPYSFQRELVALFSLSSWCLVIVVWLFLAMPWVCLQFVIVVFPDHTHLLFISQLYMPYFLKDGKTKHIALLYRIFAHHSHPYPINMLQYECPHQNLGKELCAGMFKKTPYSADKQGPL